MEWCVNVNIRVNDDAQLVVTETWPVGMGQSAPVVLSRARSLALAGCIVAHRVEDGTVDSGMTIAAFLLTTGAVRREYDQGDRVLIEKYVDNDTGET